MKKIEKLNRFIKASVIYLIICSLIQNPFINSSFAADKASTAQEILSGVDQALNIAAQAMNTDRQMKNQLNSQMASANLIRTSGPDCVKPDGSRCYVVPSKYFGCPLPASLTSMPTNICPSASPNPADIINMDANDALANSWMNYYDKMSNLASNATYPEGLRCLEDNKNATDSQITGMMNSLQDLADQLNQQKQIFRDTNKKLLDQMSDLKAELSGGKTGNLKAETTDYAGMFSQSCQSIITNGSGKDAFKNMLGNGGLNGLFKDLSGVSKNAVDFNNNKAIYENDIRNETNKIASTISKNGVGDFLANSYIPQSSATAKTFGASIGAQIQKQNKEFATAKARIDKVLADVGYTAPALDQNFSVDLNQVMVGSNEFFKKKYINDCVTGADKGVAIPVSDILKNIQQKSTNNQGTARDDYRAALQDILNSDAMMSDKMDKIKALEADYPGMTVSYTDSSKSRITDTPYSLFMKTIDKCEQKYSSDDVFSSKGSGGVSYQEKVNRAKAALQELKNLNDSYASSLNSSILSQVLDCGGSAAKSGSCSQDSLDASKDTFCISQASQCANEIQGCYSDMQNKIKARTDKMSALANTFNTNAANMIKATSDLFNQKKAAVQNMIGFIQTKFPGTNFDVPKDMFVNMPPDSKKDTYGISVLADGNLDALLDGKGDVTVKILKLKEMFASQKKEVDQKIDDYKRLQEDAMTREKAKWAEVQKRCESNAGKSREGIAKNNADGMKNQNDVDRLVGQYCKKYRGIVAKNSANPNCSAVKDLANIMAKISEKGADARITNEAVAVSNGFNDGCENQTGESNQQSYYNDCMANASTEKNETKMSQQKSECSKRFPLANNKVNPAPSMQLRNICKKDTDNEQKFLENVYAQLPDSEKETLKGKTTLEDASSEDKTSDNTATFFEKINTLIEKGNRDNICEQLKKINNHKPTNPDIDKATTEVASASKEFDDAKNSSSSGVVTDPTSQLFKAKQKLDKANEQLTKFNDIKIFNEKKELLTEALAALGAAKSGDSSITVAATQSNLGQQSVGTCDSQSNSMLGKNPLSDMFALPKGYDEAMLGTSK